VTPISCGLCAVDAIGCIRLLKYMHSSAQCAASTLVTDCKENCTVTRHEGVTGALVISRKDLLILKFTFKAR
jgi:hypothetical protein